MNVWISSMQVSASGRASALRPPARGMTCRIRPAPAYSRAMHAAGSTEYEDNVMCFEPLATSRASPRLGESTKSPRISLKIGPAGDEPVAHLMDAREQDCQEVEGFVARLHRCLGAVAPAEEALPLDQVGAGMDLRMQDLSK